MMTALPCTHSQQPWPYHRPSPPPCSLSRPLPSTSYPTDPTSPPKATPSAASCMQPRGVWRPGGCITTFHRYIVLECI